MNVHKNARLTPFGRAEIVRRVIEKVEALRHRRPAETGGMPRLAARRAAGPSGAR